MQYLDLQEEMIWRYFESKIDAVWNNSKFFSLPIPSI